MTRLRDHTKGRGFTLVVTSSNIVPSGIAADGNIKVLVEGFRRARFPFPLPPVPQNNLLTPRKALSLSPTSRLLCRETSENATPQVEQLVQRSPRLLEHFIKLSQSLNYDTLERA